MVITDAFLAYRHELRQKDAMEDQIDDFSTILPISSFSMHLLRRLYDGNLKGNLKLMFLLLR